MSSLDGALQELSDLTTFRVNAEARSGQVWRDIVFSRIQQRHLNPLQSQEQRLQTALHHASAVINQALNDL